MDYTKPFRCIIEIEKCKSISLAAEKLSISQPTLSKYLKSVEAELGAELFDRSTSPISLTPAGKCFVETAKKIVDADSQLQKKISDIQETNYPIIIGVGSSRAPYIMPTILKEFHHQSPSTEIIIQEGTTSQINEGLLSGNIDLAISVADSKMALIDKEILFTESILLATPISKENNDFHSALNNYPIISFGKGQLLTNLLTRLPEHHSVIECQNIITALELVKAGLGSTLVPSYIAKFGEKHRIQYYPLPIEFSNESQRDVCIFYRKSQFLSSKEVLFIDCAKKALNTNKI